MNNQLIHVANCLKNVKSILKDTPINVTNIHLIIRTVMEVVEETPVKGSYQKTLALRILRRLFIDFTDDDIESTLISLLDSGAIGNLIDLIADSSKGKTNINKIIDTTATCCKFWIPLIPGRLRVRKVSK
jgi:hypothetical protein